MMPCSTVGRYQHCGGHYCLHLQRRVHILRTWRQNISLEHCTYLTNYRANFKEDYNLNIKWNENLKYFFPLNLINRTHINTKLLHQHDHIAHIFCIYLIRLQQKVLLMVLWKCNCILKKKGEREEEGNNQPLPAESCISVNTAVTYFIAQTEWLTSFQQFKYAQSHFIFLTKSY